MEPSKHQNHEKPAIYSSWTALGEDEISSIRSKRCMFTSERFMYEVLYLQFTDGYLPNQTQIGF